MKHKIRKYREAAGLTQGELGAHLGLTLLAVHNLEAGKTKLTVDRLEQISNVLNIPIFDLLDSGNSTGDGLRPVQIVGYVGAGAEIYPFDEMSSPGDDIDSIDLPIAVSVDAVGVRVKGDSMVPRFDAGDVLIYGTPRSDTSSLIAMTGKPCVIQLSDGRMLVKILKASPAPGRWNLASFNHKEMKNQLVEWAARIEAVIPA